MSSSQVKKNVVLRPGKTKNIPNQMSKVSRKGVTLGAQHASHGDHPESGKKQTQKGAR